MRHIRTLRRRLFTDAAIGSVLLVLIGSGLAFLGYRVTHEAKATPCPISNKLVSSCGVLWGFYSTSNGSISGRTYNDLEAANKFNRKFDIVKYYEDFSGGTIPSLAQKDSANKGRIVHIAWETRLFGGIKNSTLIPEPPLGAGMCQDTSIKQYSWDQFSRGIFDAYIDKTADNIKALGKPVFIDINHEPDVFAYSGSGCTSITGNDYVNIYRRIVDRFRAKQVNNVVWVWVLAGYNYSGWTDLSFNPKWINYYPGDTYVDWIAWDPYANNTATRTSPYANWNQGAYGLYDWIKKGGLDDAPKGGTGAKYKPLMLAEYGTAANSGRFVPWVSQIPTDLKRLPGIKAVEYFDSQCWSQFTGSNSGCGITYDERNITAFRDAGKDPYVNVWHGAPIETADKSVPSVTITSPTSNATVSGVTNITAAASDNVGIARVEFRVDGVLKGTKTTSPYTYSWDTTIIADGTHTLQAKAYDTNNNTASSADVTVTVKNAGVDTTPPRAPTNLRVTSVSGTSVGLAWTASTDNLRVAGYYVQRSDRTIAQVTGTTYTATNQPLSTDTATTYTVRAYDAAGNVSPASNVVEVKASSAITGDTSAPTAPTGLATNINSSNQVNLTWNASTDNLGVVGYNILRNGTKIATAGQTSFGDATAAAGTSYTYTVTAYDGAGNISPASNAASATTPSRTLANTPGLATTYFPNLTLSGNGIARSNDVVNFNWGSGAPTSGIGSDQFSARWTGRVWAPTTGTYTFFVRSDDGVKVWVDGKLLIDDWTEHGAVENSGTITLEGKTSYDIKIEYFEKYGLSSINLLWQGPGVAKVVIPLTNLTSTSQGLTGTYYTGTSFNSKVMSRIDPTIDFNWGTNAPNNQLPADNVSIRWTGGLYVPVSGTYNFHVQSDDGTRLWVNDKQIINDWTDHGMKENTGTMYLTAGVKYPIKLEYYERGGSAAARLLWSGPNTPKAVIPHDMLRDR